MSEFAIRPMTAADEGFVFRAWLEGYWPNFPGNVVMSKSEFLQRWHGVIERLLADPQTRTLIAHVEGKPDSLLGFVCGGSRCLHWVYVKQAFRKLGIARELTGEVGACDFGTISHWCEAAGRVDAGWRYDPGLLKGYGA